jgi:RHS repeat-associated protein
VATLAGDFEGDPSANRYFKAPGRPDAPNSLAGFGFDALVSLAWSDGSDNEDEFIVERQPVTGGAWSEVGRSGADQLAFQDSSAVPGIPYRYRVRASNDFGTSDPSNEVQATRNGTAPSAPDNVLAGNQNGTVRVSWRDNSDNETGFEIQRRRVSDGSLTTFSAASPATAYDDDTAIVGVAYCYRVRAVNASGPSGDSSESCVTPAYVPDPDAVIGADDLTPSPGVPVRFRNRGTIGSDYTATWHTSEGTFNGHTVYLTFNSTGPKEIRLIVRRSEGAADEDEAVVHALVETSVAGTGTGGSSGNTQAVHGADPVNLASGSYFYQRTDLKLPGIGIPFEFTRHYDSKVNDTNGLPLGYGWNYTPFITVQTNDAGAIVFYGDGHSEVHTNTPAGYVGDPGVFDRLVKNGDGSWQVISKQQTTNHVNAAGQLVFIRDRNGNTINLDYETDPAAQGRLKQVTDTVGRTNLFHPYPGNPALIGRIEDVLGRSTWFTYDGNTNLVAVTNALNRVTTFAYNERHQITNAVDNRGHLIVHNDYNAEDNTVTNQVDAFGKTTRFVFDFAEHKTTQINALGDEAVYRFDDRLLLTNLVDEAGFTTAYEYDPNRNRIRIQDRNGNVARLAHDERGNVTNKLDALNQPAHAAYDSRNNPVRRIDTHGNELNIGYDAQGNVRFTTNALGYVTEVFYLTNGLPEVITDTRGFSLTNVWENGNLVETWNALGHRTRMVYDAAGRRTQLIDALNRTNRFVFDDEDNLIHTVNALGQTNFTAYDANRNPVASLDPRGATATNVFDLRDRLIASIDTQDHTVTNLYDELDRKVGLIDQRGKVTRFGLNPIGHLLSLTNALDQVTLFRRDPNGNPTNVVDAAGFTNRNWFDPLDRLFATVDPNGNTNLTGYDALGRVVATTNANGQVTRFLYDSLSRLTNVVDADGGNVFFDYDETGNRIRTTDPRGNVWTNQFDPLGRLVEQFNPLGKKTVLQYDAVGNLTNRLTPNGVSIGFQHDALNRLTNIVYPDGSTVALAYDEVGNLTNMVDSAGTTAWSFDLLNRPLSITDPFGQVVSNRFDAAGNRTVLHYPDGKEVLYGYDALNRMESLTNWLGGEVHYSRDARGLVTHTVNANGTIVDVGYDPTGRLTSIGNRSATGELLASEGVQLDAVGNQTRWIGSGPLVPILQNTNVNHAYDADNRLTSVNGKVVTHDANGNLTGLGTDSYRFDPENRLLSYAVGGTQGGQHRYDGLGIRLQHTTNGVVRRFVIDRVGSLTQVLAETDDSGNTLAFYVYGVGLAQRITPDGHTGTYHFDLRGSTLLLTSDTGEQVAAYAYGTFGEVADSDEDWSQPFHYLGKFGIMDDGNGLYHARARYWNPHLGRFISQDPLWGNDASSQSWNRYVYALNNPLRYFDPTGLVAADSVKSSSSGSKESLEQFLERAASECRSLYEFVERCKVEIPKGVDIEDNLRFSFQVADGSLQTRFLTFYYLVKNKGPWDYKQRGGEFEAFGNFHYGYVGKAFDLTGLSYANLNPFSDTWPEFQLGNDNQVLLRAAGVAQKMASTSLPNSGNLFVPPYWDDPVDQFWIKSGFEWFNANH